MGDGVTTWSDGQWSAYNGVHPLTPCGYGNDLGNRTGIKVLTIPETTSGSTTVTAKTFNVPRWRGFDNPFGDINTNLDGIILKRDAANKPSKVFVTDDPAKYGDDVAAMNNMEVAGMEIAKEGYTKLFDLGETAEIIPSVMEGSTTTYKCDYH